MNPQHLGELVRDGEARIETRQRILEDHGDVFAHEQATLAFAETQ